jgi:16S rRNA (guanine527-N7)-methyltransferase
VAAADGHHSPPALLELLAEARSAGYLGPGPLQRHLAHAEGFVAVARRLLPGTTHAPRLVDLGSGGGLPGLVVAVRWPEASVTLLEVNGRRAVFLRRAVERLQVEGAVSVLQERAEVCGRDEAYRANFDGVLARSFGPPAVVAECAAPLLAIGGWLVVSEPPPFADAADDTGQPGAARWPAGPLRPLGLEPVGIVREGFDYMTLRQVESCPERFPRRDGVPAKRPLF